MAGRSSWISKKGKGTTVTLTIPRGAEMILADERGDGSAWARDSRRG